MDNSYNDMNNVDKITLECLMNPGLYEKYVIDKTEDEKIAEIVDKAQYLWI